MNFTVNSGQVSQQSQPHKARTLTSPQASASASGQAPSDHAAIATARRQSFATRPSLVNPSQSAQQIEQSIVKCDGSLLAQQVEHLLSRPALAQEFGPAQAARPGHGESIESAHQGLKPVSQHQVLDLGHGDAAVTESGRSLKLKTEGSVFAPERLGPGARLDIVAHGSQDGSLLGGKTPAQLAQQLQAAGITELQTLNLMSCHSASFAEALARELAGLGLKVAKIEAFAGRIAIETASGKALTEQAGQWLEQQQGHSGALGLFDNYGSGSSAMHSLDSAFSMAVNQGDYTRAVNVMMPYVRDHPEELDRVVKNALRTAAGDPPDATRAQAFGETVRLTAWKQLETHLQISSWHDQVETDASRMPKLEQLHHFTKFVVALDSPQGIADAALLYKKLGEPGLATAMFKQAATLAAAQNQPHPLMRVAQELPEPDAVYTRQAMVEALNLAIKGARPTQALQAMRSLHEAAPEDDETTKICLRAAHSICTHATARFPEKTLETIDLMVNMGARAPAQVIDEVFGSKPNFHRLMLNTVLDISTKTQDPALLLDCAYSLRDLSRQVSPAVIATVVGKPESEGLGALRVRAIAMAKSALTIAQIDDNFNLQLDVTEFLKQVMPKNRENATTIRIAYREIAEKSPDMETALPAIRGFLEFVNALADGDTKTKLKAFCYERLASGLIPATLKSKSDLVLEGAHLLVELEAPGSDARGLAVDLAKQVIQLNQPALSLEAAQIMSNMLPLVAQSRQPGLQNEVLSAVKAAVAQGKTEHGDLGTMLEAVQFIETLVVQNSQSDIPNLSAYVQSKLREVVELAIAKNEPETALDALREVQDRAIQMAPEGRGDLPAFLFTQSRAVCDLALTQGKPATAIGALSLISEGIDDGVIGAHASLSVYLVAQGSKAVDLALAARDPETALAGNRFVASHLTAADPKNDHIDRSIETAKQALTQGDYEIALEVAHQLVDFKQFDMASKLLNAVTSSAKIPSHAGFGFGSSSLADDESEERDRFRKENIVVYTPKGESKLSPEQRVLLDQFTNTVCDKVREIYTQLERGEFPPGDRYHAESYVRANKGLAAAKIGYTIESVVTDGLKAASSYDEASGRYRFNVGGREDQALYWKAQGSLNLPSSTRPDIFVDLGNKKEALIDLTSQLQTGHIITGKSPNWLGRENIRYVREVTYPSMTKSQLQVIRNHLNNLDKADGPISQLSNRILMVQSHFETSQQAMQKSAEVKFVRQIAGLFGGKSFADAFFGGNKTHAAKFMKMYNITKKGISASAASPTTEQARDLKQRFIEGVKRSDIVRSRLGAQDLVTTPFDRYATG